MISRVLLVIFTIFTFVLLSLGAPIPESVELDKRITHWGRGTWFHVGHGNCGSWNVDSDPIVAIPKSLYDQNGGSNCDQWIKITNTDTGKTVYGKARDSCPSCGSGDLDLSPSLFGELASLSKGVISLEWNFMSKKWHP